MPHSAGRSQVARFDIKQGQASRAGQIPSPAASASQIHLAEPESHDALSCIFKQVSTPPANGERAAALSRSLENAKRQGERKQVFVVLRGQLVWGVRHARAGRLGRGGGRPGRRAPASALPSLAFDRVNKAFAKIKRHSATRVSLLVMSSRTW